MLSELYNAGWVHQEECRVVQGGSCLYLSLEHPDYFLVSLEIHVCLDEMPALTMVSLLDGSGVIEKEWSDKEINVSEITAAAKAAQEAAEEEDE